MSLSRDCKVKLSVFFITITLYTLLFTISMTYLNDLYLFNWTANHLYGFTWLIALFLIPADKIILSLFLTLGNFLGVILGQFLGDYILSKNIAKITSSMNAEAIYKLHHHYGFEIWLLSVIISFILGLIIINLKKHK